MDKGLVFIRLMMNVLLTNMHIFTLQNANWRTGFILRITLMFYQLFGLSFWRHPFTAEDPLVRKWCNDELLQIMLSHYILYSSIYDHLQIQMFFVCLVLHRLCEWSPETASAAFKAFPRTEEDMTTCQWHQISVTNYSWQSHKYPQLL